MLDSTAPPAENRETNVPRSCAPPPEKERLPHSRWGIASFVFVLCAHTALVLLYFFLYWMLFDYSMIVFVLLFGLYVNFVVSLATLIFGVIGVCQLHTRKVFSVLGIILSLPSLLLLFYGLAVSLVRGFGGA